MEALFPLITLLPTTTSKVRFCCKLLQNCQQQSKYIFTRVGTYRYILLEVFPVGHSPNNSQEWSQSTTDESHFKGDPCPGVQSQSGVLDKGCWRDSQCLLYLWCRQTNRCMWSRYQMGTPVLGTDVANFCFPRRTVCYSGFFVLCLSWAPNCAYQRCPGLAAEQILFPVSTSPLPLGGFYGCSITGFV